MPKKNVKTIQIDKICSTIPSKARGLMFSLKPKTLVMEFSPPRKVGLHMFFVFFPIDVLFLDDKKKVVEVKENFAPFTFYNPKYEASYCVELPAGTISYREIKVGEFIFFK